MGAEDFKLPNDLTPFITRTTQDHVSGGGYGDVWKCNYNANGSAFVAVKAFRFPEGHYDPEKINKKINREIGILMILRHDNIVPLLGTTTGFGRKPELLSLVTPWILNGTLNVYLASKHNELTMLDRSRMLKDVSAGLRYLHSVPVVHGDITGANILIDEGGHAKLIDFGLSTAVLPLFGQPHLAATSIHAGAIPYAAPELLSDNVSNLPLKKTDIYSFGCVMLQILSGRHPWSEIKFQNLEWHIYSLIRQGRSPQRPAGHPIMDSDWDIIQKCLQFKFELRPSADEVFDLVMRRVFSSDSSSPPNGPPDDASLNTDSLPSSLPSSSTGPITPFSTDSFRSTGILGHERMRSTSPSPLPLSALSSNYEQMRLRQRNVVIFGETGTGKSSIINAIAQQQLAKTSNDAHGCTSTSQRYQVEISDQRFNLIDTAGLSLGAADTPPAAKAEKQLKILLRELVSSRLDAISLLVYCMHSTIAPRALDKAYNKFYFKICQEKVPIVVVITGLEKETRMESWWDTNKEKFKGLNFADHACVTALREHPSFSDNITRRIAESGDILRKLVLTHFVDLAVDDGLDSAADKSWLKQMGGRIVKGRQVTNKK